MQYFQNQRQQHSTLALSTFSASPPILLLPHTNSCVKLHVHVCVCYLGGLYALNYRFKTIFKNLECSHPSLPPSSTPETHIWFCSKTKLKFLLQVLAPHTCGFSTLLSHRLWDILHGAAMSVTGKHAKQKQGVKGYSPLCMHQTSCSSEIHYSFILIIRTTNIM